MKEKKRIMDGAAIARTLTRLSHEIVEKNKGTDDLCLIGVKRRGEILARRINSLIDGFYNVKVPVAGIDIGMFRDDLVREFFVPDASTNDFGFSIDGQTVVLCDDVLHTGRTVRAAIEALFAFGRPAKIQLLILADRGGKQMPVCADFVGKNIPVSDEEFLDVALAEIEGEDGLSVGSAE